jgi:transposase-like protein
MNKRALKSLRCGVLEEPALAPTDKHVYFPRPYPDELAYSVLARAHRQLGGPSVKPVNAVLFGNSDVVATADLTANLLSLAPKALAAEADAPELLAWSLTLLPYYAAGLAPPVRRKLARTQAGVGAHGLHTRLGICASAVRVPARLRACAQCVASDVKYHGEPYWHRAHQLPGVLVCPDHGTPLLVTEVSMRPRGRHEFVALKARHVESARLQTVPSEAQGILWDLTRRLRDLLEYPIDAPALPDRAELHGELISLGYGRGRVAQERLESDFRALFPESVLCEMDGAVRPDEPIRWVRTLGHRRQHGLHPLRRTLLELFIEHTTRTSHRPAFGQGPWPCLNWVSDHCGKPLVEEIQPFRDRRHPERVLARFHCPFCGFTFTRMVGQPDPTRPLRVIEFGPVFVDQAKVLQRDGYPLRTIARLLGVYWSTAKRFLEPESPGRQPNEKSTWRQHRDQEAWLTLLARYPGDGIKAVRARNPALYTRLYRTCRAWLLQHPPRQSQGARSRVRVDWQARDAALSRRIEQEARAIVQEQPLKRVTIHALGSRLECRATLEKQLDRLPRTRESLRRWCETPEAFRVRRLRNAALQSEADTPVWKLVRTAAIRPEHITERLLFEAGLSPSHRPDMKETAREGSSAT